MFIKLFLIALLVFLAIDITWLGVIAKGMYAEELGSLMKKDVNWVAAFIFYAIFIAGLVFFVISPSVAGASLANALIVGAFFGFVTYSTYDLTNLAVLKDWPLKITVIDIIWGTILASSVSGITYLIATKFLL
ncbi:MAG: DUF2177 family protein [Candidatus Paceibacterota bacterium]